ncbi:MAG: nuclear transport factor 2 family protein [Sphingomicrobium sp.]
MKALDAWHQFVRDANPAKLRALLDADMIFESPVVHKPQHGREIGMRYLLGAVSVLGNVHFQYVGTWTNDTGAVLEFVTEIDGILVNGVDIMRFSEDGERIVHFKVMVRPIKAVEIVRERMAALLAASPA